MGKRRALSYVPLLFRVSRYRTLTYIGFQRRSRAGSARARGPLRANTVKTDAGSECERPEGVFDARLVAPPVPARRLVVKPEAEHYQYKPCNGTTQEQASGVLLDGAIPTPRIVAYQTHGSVSGQSS